MDPSYQVLILGVETALGQSVLKRLREKLPVLKIAVPPHQYSPSIEIPPYVVPEDQSGVLAFKQVHTVLCCSMEHLQLKAQATNAGCKFIRICSSYNKVIQRSCFHKLGFRPSGAVSLYQKAGSLGFWAFWWLAHRNFLRPQEGRNEKWKIVIGRSHSLEFDNLIFAWLFYLIAMIVHFIPYRSHKTCPVPGSSSWRFEGDVDIEGHGKSQKHHFEAISDSVDCEVLRLDLAVLLVVKSLGAEPETIDHWTLFDGLNLRLTLQRKPSKSSSKDVT
jgi:hypothetical protein